MSGATGWMYLVGLGYGWTGGKTVAAVLEVMQAVQNPSAYTIHYTVLYCVEICVALREIQTHPGRHMATPNPPKKNNILQDVSEWGFAMPMSFLRPAVQLG